MLRNLIFVFALLATLSMVNAVPHQLLRRKVSFNDCPITDIPTVGVSVTDPIKPASTATFGVFAASLNHDIVAGKSFIAITFADESGKKILNDVYTQLFTESIHAGSTVQITAQNVPTPVDLPQVFTIGVGIGDPVEGNPITPINYYGCAYAVDDGQ